MGETDAEQHWPRREKTGRTWVRESSLPPGRLNVGWLGAHGGQVCGLGGQAVHTGNPDFMRPPLGRQGAELLGASVTPSENVTMPEHIHLAGLLCRADELSCGMHIAIHA